MEKMKMHEEQQEAVIPKEVVHAVDHGKSFSLVEELMKNAQNTFEENSVRTVFGVVVAVVVVVLVEALEMEIAVVLVEMIEVQEKEL